MPGVQTVRRLSLDLRQADLGIDCVTHQGIPLGVKGVLIYKVGDDFASIANAARWFLDQQDQMDQRVHNVFAGHLRAIVGNMTVEEMIRDREKLTSLTRSSSGAEMEELGLVVDSLQIQEIDDPTGYIKNLGRPHAAAVERDARIAQAQSDQSATEAEQEADARKAQARRASRTRWRRFCRRASPASSSPGTSSPRATGRTASSRTPTRPVTARPVTTRPVRLPEPSRRPTLVPRGRRAPNRYRFGARTSRFRHGTRRRSSPFGT